MAIPSPAPGTPQTFDKAYVATALTALGVFLSFWFADADKFTTKDILEALLAALISSGITGFGTAKKANKAKNA